LTVFLVDTHALLWFLGDDDRLSATAKTSMESSENVLLISAACLWEIAIKAGLGKLGAPDEFLDVMRREGFDSLEVGVEDAWAVRSLPRTPHKDPFDRLLSAQALRHDLPVISDDGDLDHYGVSRHW
jgi:PIN domain nuclease of toxin-antitoxin system